MDFAIKNKVALVFASSEGLGKSTARHLVKEGARVCICSRNPEKLRQTQEEIGAELFIPANLDQPGAAESVISDVEEKLGLVDILVINCGGPPNSTFEKTSSEQWRDAFESLWMTPIAAINRVLPGMKGKNWGRILIINSLAAREPLPEFTLSNSLRAGLPGFVKSLSKEIGKHNITVNSLLPGVFATERLKGVPNLDAVIEKIPLKRLGEPDEFGAFMTFLASEQASYITGQSYLIDGGLSAAH